MKRHIVITFFFVAIFSMGNAQNIFLRQTHNNSGTYQEGEKIRVTAFLKGNTTPYVQVKIWKNFNKKYILKTLPYNGDSLVIYNDTLESPGNIIFQVSTIYDSASIGAIVSPNIFTPGTIRPKDFDKYWEHEKFVLKMLPMAVKEDTLSSVENGYWCFDTNINCTGPKPARGYFAKPRSASPKSLPIVLFLHAAGNISASWVRSKPENAIKYAKMGKGALSFDLNAHGMLNGQPDLYYDNLQNTNLKNYQFIGLGSKRNFYFRGMYLRLIRTLDFLCSQPEWDGKRILVIGESQGGGQALAAAGLDSRVSAVVATVPAMCDWGGTLVGRKGAWPNPFAQQGFKRKKLLATLPYFDVAHLLKGVKATLVVEIGLIDETCPASAVFAALNQAVGKRYIFTDPYRAHHFTQLAYKDVWEKTVVNPKMAFIEDFLK